MQRPTRCNAGIAAPHFSQDDRLYAAPAKRQRCDALQPCQHCSRVHRSDNELDRCQRSIEAAEKSEATARRRDAEKAEAAARRDTEKAEAAARRDTEKAEAAARRDAEKAEAAARRDAEKASREFLRAARHCDSCGGSHSSEQQRLRCSRQRPARPLQPMPSQV